jgi:hypothetical protein
MYTRVNRPITEHLLSVYIYTLIIKYSPLENAPMVVKIAQNWSKMRKIHSFKVGRTVKIAFLKWIVHMAAHDGLFNPLKSNINLGINERYLPSYQTGWKLG